MPGFFSVIYLHEILSKLLIILLFSYRDHTRLTRQISPSTRRSVSLFDFFSLPPSFPVIFPQVPSFTLSSAFPPVPSTM